MAELNRDFAYWRDQYIAILGAVCLAVGLGHLLDWLNDRSSFNRNITLCSLLVYLILLLVAPRRFNFIFFSVAGIAAWGLLGVVASRNLVGLAIVVPFAVCAIALLKWKGHLL
jgi:hypothetical protein